MFEPYLDFAHWTLHIEHILHEIWIETYRFRYYSNLTIILRAEISSSDSGIFT